MPTSFWVDQTHTTLDQEVMETRGNRQKVAKGTSMKFLDGVKKPKRNQVVRNPKHNMPDKLAGAFSDTHIY